MYTQTDTINYEFLSVSSPPAWPNLGEYYTAVVSHQQHPR